MDAVRLIVEALLREAAESFLRRLEADRAGRPAAAEPERPYDAYSLASRPLPSGLRLHPHPRDLSAEAVRRITAGIAG